MSNSENDSTAFEEISSAIDQLISQSQKNEKDYEILEELLTNLLLSSVKLHKSIKEYELIEALAPQMNSEEVKSLNFDTLEIQKLCKTFKVSRIVFLHNLNLIAENADYVCDEIIDKHLRKWRENQILGHSNEDQAMENLNKFQNWCERLTKLLWLTRSRLRMESMYGYFLNELDDTIPSYLQQIYEDVTNLMVNLIKQTVIVEKQPPQVLSSNKTFSTNIRLLVGDAMHNVIKPSVTVSIVSEQQAQNFKNLMKESDLNCGKLKNCSAEIKFDKKSWKSVATFDALKVTKITKSKDETNEKFGLLFQTTIRDNETELHIKSLSMPFVLNDNRKPASNDVISWDNVFPVFDRPPFDLAYFMKRLPSKLCLKMQVCALSEKTLTDPKLKLITDSFVGGILDFALSRALSVGNKFSSVEKNTLTFLRGNLNKISLPDRILSLAELKMLYQSTLPHIEKHKAFDKYSSHQKEQNAENDPMKAEKSLLSFSEIRFNFPIDKTLPAIVPPTCFTFYPSFTMPSSPPPRINFFTRCWSRMNNGEANDEYDMLP
ncbi:unnamed protein product [Diamesa tonsa]